MRIQYCSICNVQICPPSGRSEELLIVGEFPGQEELRKGHPFATNPNFMTAGKIFRKELERVGLSIADFRVCNLWKHEPTRSEECFQDGYNSVLDEAKGKKAILLVGSDTVSTFTEFKVSEVNGLRVDSSILSAPLLMAMVNPSLAEHRGIGEVRFAVERWKYWLEKEELLSFSIPDNYKPHSKYLRDEFGDLVKDKNGDPVLVYEDMNT